MTSSFITCYRRLYVDIPPFLVISPNLTKNYFSVCDLDKKWCFACKADFWNDPYFFIWTLRPYFKSYFCRLYKDAFSVLVTLTYLAKYFFNVRDLDKNSVLSPILTFGTAPIFLYERWPPVFMSFFRRSYVYTLHILVTRKSLAQKLL